MREAILRSLSEGHGLVVTDQAVPVMSQVELGIVAARVAFIHRNELPMDREFLEENSWSLGTLKYRVIPALSVEVVPELQASWPRADDADVEAAIVPSIRTSSQGADWRAAQHQRQHQHQQWRRHRRRRHHGGLCGGQQKERSYRPVVQPASWAAGYKSIDLDILKVYTRFLWTAVSRSNF